MSESSRRAVLLARPGAACERLRSALSDAGAHVVLEADPTTLQLETLGQVAPQVIVVALDPVTEDVIEKFDPVLADPSVEVIYEEAALAATREGWDLARWARHLGAKLHGHGDVLPPGHEPEGMEPPEPAIPSRPVEMVAPAAPVSAVDAPRAAPVVEAPVAAPIEASPLEVAPIEAASPGGLSLAPIEAVSPSEPADVQLPAVEHVSFAESTLALTDDTPQVQFTHEASYSPFDPVAAEADFDLAGTAEPSPGLTDIELTFAADAPMVSADAIELSAELVIEPFESSFDYEVADTAAPVFETPAFDTTVSDAPEFAASAVEVVELPASETHAAAPVLMFEASREGAAAPAAPKVAAPSAPDWSFTDEATTAAPVSRENDPNHKFQRDLGDIERRISSLELVEERAVTQLPGAILVLAGIGGPDAVRQLLGGLPEEFPRPVLVQQRLDGGRYDRLVAQMQRATPLQVRLAEPGLIAMAGTIYILPADISITVSESGMRFVEGGGDVLGTLPAGDSAVLMLSGADPAQVDAALKLSSSGALVAGQSGDGCYDAVAASALIARGAQSGQPAELSARLAERWR
ncbi:chemotaxis protein CheB [Lysobacter auxotrophicus]|uniref:Chemotaxis protein n=1 Tax=Lysobacter auxotrophicus TaxID=2992573 RepID=A0ABM8DAP2_9GAMM|nr:chemotaxis protein CheB [Lysobacter auxotrophicus]BDU15640.1 chemotaxis protein [Lysobacter auxotrophicus]